MGSLSCQERGLSETMAEVRLHWQKSAVLARRLPRTQLAAPWQTFPRPSRPAHLTQLLFHPPSGMTPEGGGAEPFWVVLAGSRCPYPLAKKAHAVCETQGGESSYLYHLSNVRGCFLIHSFGRDIEGQC